MLPTDLPFLKATVRLGGKDSDVTTPWYDVKFYPYTPSGVDPVFAVVGDRHTVICRCVPDKERSVETIRWFTDEEDSQLNSVEWSQAGNGDPLVCVTGKLPKIKVLNVKTGALVTVLSGHGKAVNDLAISPASPHILASASEDDSIRIWSLDPAHKKQPTAVKCFGGAAGHRETILAIGFHRTGRYLLSGGMDTIVNLWVIPEKPEENAGTDRPTLIHDPHFSTTEIHTDFIDCVRFFGDLIISRAAKENKILLWRIDNFNSQNLPPSPEKVPLPKSMTGTRSAWGGRFQRLLQFDLPYAGLFYLRFGLFHELGKHPILVAGNEKSKLFFWDLQRLEEAGAVDDPGFKVPSKKNRKDAGGSAPSSVLGLGGRPGLMRQGSEVSNASSAAQSSSSFPVSAAGSTGSGVEKAKGKGTTTNPGIGDPFHSVAAHKAIVVGKVTFVVRQISWSRGGEWCVAVGDNGMITLFRRWEDGIPE